MELELERSEEHTSELQSHVNLVCRLLLEKKKIRYQSSNLDPQIDPKVVNSNPVHGTQASRFNFRLRLYADFKLTENCFGCVFFFNDTATTEIYTLSLHDALPI